MWLVKAIYIMYKIWLISPLSWHCPRRARATLAREQGHQKGRAGLSNTFLALKGGGEEVPVAPPDTKTWREFF